MVALFKQQTPGVCRVSLRSKGDVDVRRVALAWGRAAATRTPPGSTVNGDFAAAQHAVIAAIGQVLPA